MKRHQIIRFIFAVLLILFSVCASAGYSNKQADDITGKPGDAADVTREIKITTIEYMFLPAEIDVTQGETIKFVVINKGSKKHEMAIDTKRNLKKLAKMRRHGPEADANGSNLLKLEPGEQKTLIWEFARAGAIDFACPLPGHFKGMRGKINVETK